MADNMDLTLVARQARRNSERWFPKLHDGTIKLGPFYCLALAGEVGEACNIMKKAVRHVLVKPSKDDFASELADIFTYLMLLADEYQIDLMAEFEKKQSVCEMRWGGRKSASD